MNSSISNRSIHGFRVSFLEKVCDIKSGNVTALEMISKMIKDTNEELISFIDDLQPLQKLTNVSFKSLDEDYNEILRQFKALEKEVSEIGNYRISRLYQEKDEKYIENLKTFYNQTKDKIDLLKIGHDNFKDEIRKVFTFFGEEHDTKITPEQLITFVTKFTMQFNNAYKDYLQKMKRNVIVH